MWSDSMNVTFGIHKGLDDKRLTGSLGGRLVRYFKFFHSCLFDYLFLWQSGHIILTYENLG